VVEKEPILSCSQFVLVCGRGSWHLELTLITDEGGKQNYQYDTVHHKEHSNGDIEYSVLDIGYSRLYGGGSFPFYPLVAQP
jgi:hypothetical protein